MYVRTENPPQRQAQTPEQILARYRQLAPVNVIAVAAEFGLNVWEMHSLPANIGENIP
jgi:hypothetical protein